MLKMKLDVIYEENGNVTRKDNWPVKWYFNLAPAVRPCPCRLPLPS